MKPPLRLARMPIWSRKHATQYIPRSYVISREGKILSQTVGYKEEEFAKLVTGIEKELARKP